MGSLHQGGVVTRTAAVQHCSTMVEQPKKPMLGVDFALIVLVQHALVGSLQQDGVLTRTGAPQHCSTTVEQPKKPIWDIDFALIVLVQRR